MSKKKRTIFVGIDGASYSLLRELAQTGVMPHLNTLIEEGVLSRMLAPLPDNSAVSWSSIMTGKNPGEHGIFGFTDLIPNTYTLRFPNFLSMQSSTFWQVESEKKYVIINLP
ncbi:MAG: alkaline phosphatase family protein, partial [bacterium]